MKKLIIGLTFGLIAVTAQAEETPQQTCTNASLFAEQVMKARQMGIDASKLMEIADGSILIEEYIIDAFDHPKYNTESYRRKAISEFKSRAFLDCMKAFSKK